MKLDVISLGSHQKKLQFSVPPEKVKAELDRAYNQLKRKVRLHGFRPGKAPRKVLEMRFGSQVISDVATNLIQEGYSTALQEHDIEPVSRPAVDEQGELEASRSFEFSITVDVRPEIELETYTGVEVEAPAVEVTEEEVEDAVRRRLEGQARLVEVSDRPVEKGDMVLVELTARAEGEEVVSEPGTMIRTEDDPYYPGVDDLIVGLETGGEKTATVTFSEEARTPEVAGRELEVTVRVQSIQANEIPELTDELAEELGYEGGASALREGIRGEIATAREEASKNQARANVLQALIDTNPFDVPQGMVEQQLEALMQELRLQAAYRGRDPRQVTFDEAQRADLAIRAEFAVKGGLILEHVAKKEGLEVTEADLDAKYAELADERGQSVEAIRGWFQKEEAIEELRARLLEEATLDWLLEHAEVVRTAPSEEPASEGAPAEVPLELLEGSVSDLKAALGEGAHDAHLQALLDAEQEGKARKGALRAIEARMQAIG